MANDMRPKIVIAQMCQQIPVFHFVRAMMSCALRRAKNCTAKHGERGAQMESKTSRVRCSSSMATYLQPLYIFSALSTRDFAKSRHFSATHMLGPIVSQCRVC